MKSISITAVDLFCGVGGLTKGLQKSGINVTLGVDIDPACKYPYEENNNAKFLLKSVHKVTAKEIKKATDKNSYVLLAGCAPCQPFSRYRQGEKPSRDSKWHLLNEFTRLVREAGPDFVTMENVPGLVKERIFKKFTHTLRDMGFFVSYKVVNCADYGVPQHRRRLVLLASKLGDIKLVKSTVSSKNYKTVRAAIAHLPRLKAGQVNPSDELHQSSALSEINLKRIVSSRPGGSWKDWDDQLVADCHKKKTGKT